jgi:sRNA-binding carbon storage regulator CsrA
MVFMGHLVISRKVGQTFRLTLAPGADPASALRELQTLGIDIELAEMRTGQVRLGIDAPSSILILRSELIDKTA